MLTAPPIPTSPRRRRASASPTATTTDRNPNTGHPIGLDAELRPATQTVYHDVAHPSHILLPLVD